MKKIFFATAVLIAGSFISVNARTTREKTDKEIRKQIRKERRERKRELRLHYINTLTESQFDYDFPNAKNVAWKEGEFAEATFYDGSTLKTAYYDADHVLVGTTNDVDYSMLPAKAKHYINKKYPGYSVRQVILFDDNESNNTDMFLFSSPFKDENTFFPVLSNGSKEIILKVTVDGNVSFFRNYK